MRYLQGDRRQRYAKFMLDAGADPDMPKAAGQTPVMLAEKYPEVKQVLRKARNNPRPAAPTSSRGGQRR